MGCECTPSRRNDGSRRPTDWESTVCRTHWSEDVWGRLVLLVRYHKSRPLGVNPGETTSDRVRGNLTVYVNRFPFTRLSRPVQVVLPQQLQKDNGTVRRRFRPRRTGRKRGLSLRRTDGTE